MKKYKKLQVYHLLMVFAAILLSSCANSHIEDSKTQQSAIRGVWLTNVASQVLYSNENIKEAVELCDRLGFNTIFVVTLNRSYTLYPSKVMDKLTGHKIHPDFEGRDPLQELIHAANEKDIKVFAWFEFGFASSYGDSTGGPIIQANPHWASLDNAGKITEKNGFQWMNAFHPEVQGFLNDLIIEVVQNYDIAGIQGDDRLPALPSNGGYDDFTVSRYKESHGGNEPPMYEKDYDWIKWRSALLTEFLSDLVNNIKQVNPNTIISMAPSIYPWSEENYLQDWPMWINLGLVDLVIPQIYRYENNKYIFELDKILDEQISPEHRDLFYPGVLLQVDDYNPSEDMLREIIQINRSKNIQGEVYFFYEGIKKFESVFEELYGEKIAFPDIKKRSL